MAKRKQSTTHRRARTSRRRPTGDTITVDVSLVHDILDILDWELRQNDESSRFDSRGQEVCSGGRPDKVWPHFDESVLAMEKHLKDLLRQHDIDKAVAKALAAHGIKGGQLVALAGGHR